MYPSSLRIRAISVFSFEAGTSTFGWRAEMAFRTRVSISAIGSLVTYPVPPLYQLALTTPGTSPFSASCLKHSRQIPYFRRNARGRPQRQQRLRCRHLNFGFLRSFAILAVVAIKLSSACYCALLLCPKRHPHV